MCVLYLAHVSFTLRMLPTFLSGPVAGRCSMVAPPRDGASGEARGSAKCFACFAFARAYTLVDATGHRLGMAAKW